MKAEFRYVTSQTNDTNTQKYINSALLSRTIPTLQAN